MYVILVVSYKKINSIYFNTQKYTYKNVYKYVNNDITSIYRK